MILATKIQSEKGKEITKTANEFIFQEFTVKKQKIGEIELYYFNDSNHKNNCEDPTCINNNKTMEGICDDCKCNVGEWLLKFRRYEEEDWDIIAQGNI